MELEKQIGFLENQVEEMSNRMKNLEYDLAEMNVENNQLRERVKKLAIRPPSARRTIHQTRSNKHKHNHNYQ
jgi:regulator of replication initiation timing